MLRKAREAAIMQVCIDREARQQQTNVEQIVSSMRTLTSLHASFFTGRRLFTTQNLTRAAVENVSHETAAHLQ